MEPTMTRKLLRPGGPLNIEDIGDERTKQALWSHPMIVKEATNLDRLNQCEIGCARI